MSNAWPREWAICCATSKTSSDGGLVEVEDVGSDDESGFGR